MTCPGPRLGWVASALPPTSWLEPPSELLLLQFVLARTWLQFAWCGLSALALLPSASFFGLLWLLLVEVLVGLLCSRPGSEVRVWDCEAGCPPGDWLCL